MSREAFEKWWGAHEEWHTTKEHAWQAWQAAQAQAGAPVATVHGWFHGECVIRAFDPEAVLPAGMALYSQPQAQAGDGEANFQTAWDEFTESDDCISANAASWYAFRGGWCARDEYSLSPPAAVNKQLTIGDLNIIRQWHNTIQDTHINYFDESDADTFRKVVAAIAAAQEQSK